MLVTRARFCRAVVDVRLFAMIRLVCLLTVPVAVTVSGTITMQTPLGYR